MLTVTYDDSDKDVPCICVMKSRENLSYVCLKMELGEQAKLLYRALTEQDFKIKEKNDSIKTVTNAKEAEEYQIRPSEEDKESCDNCKHNTDSWDSDACDGCCRANSKWSGEIYPGEFEAMEHNGRMDALESEE